jgi:hypothetical protein
MSWEDLDQAAREHLEDPSTLVLPGLYFLAWGRKAPKKGT